MRVLLTSESIHQEIRSGPDPAMAALLADRLRFVNEYDEGPLTVIVVEPGDTLATLDAHFGGGLLTNAYSGRQSGEPDFRPPFETLEEHPTLYEMVFIFGDGDEGTIVLIPRAPDIDPQLLALCAQYATPAESPS